MNKGLFVEPLSCSRHISPTQLNYHATLIRDVVNMSKNIGQADCSFKKAVGFLMKYGTWPYSTAATATATTTATAQHDNQPV
jgi:hypothetical protein